MPLLPVIDIQVLAAEAFAALAHEDLILIGSIKILTLSIIATLATEGAESEELPNHIPPCYRDFADVFLKVKANILPPHREYDHVIDLEPESTIPCGPIYQLSEVELEAVCEFLDEYLVKGFIRPTKSPGGAPVVFAKKKDSLLQLCVDYWGLNKIMRKDRYPILRIDELLDRLNKVYIFTKLDLHSGYNLICLREGDEYKTAFCTRYGSFEFLVLHF